jgi:nicotinamide-nucleotide amidase
MTGPTGVRIAACAADVLENCRKAGLTLATVESCTGGLIAAALTAIPGSSDVLDRGFVTYSNDAKTGLVGVPAELIESHGAVSKEVACAMAEGGLSVSGADIAVAVTGIAGPGGGSAEKPVGLVHLACARGTHDTRHQHYVFPGDRDAVREASVLAALEMIAESVG